MVKKVKRTQVPFGFERPEDSPGFLLWQTTVLWQRAVKKVLTPYDISHAQFVIMAQLIWFGRHGHDVTQGAIISASKLDKMTVSKSLKALAAKKLVSRAEHEMDTRAKSVQLTDEGKELINLLVPLVESVDRDFFQSLADQDIKDFNALLGKLICSNEEGAG